MQRTIRANKLVNDLREQNINQARAKLPLEEVVVLSQFCLAYCLLEEAFGFPDTPALAFSDEPTATFLERGPSLSSSSV
jgi:hypothetical protein